MQEFVTVLLDTADKRAAEKISLEMLETIELKTSAMLDSLIRQLTALPAGKRLRQITFCHLRKEEVARIAHSFFEKALKPSSAMFKEENN